METPPELAWKALRRVSTSPVRGLRQVTPLVRWAKGQSDA